MFRLESPAESYWEIVRAVRTTGSEVSPRNVDTLELTGVTFVFDDPTDNFIFEDSDKISFLESEIETVKSGEPPEQKASSEIVERLDLEEDGTFFESGIRSAVSSNWDRWVDQLGNDSRKCAATFTNPEDEDPPCTIAMQFMLRDNQLDLYTFNRSQDITFAFPMDAGLFGSLQAEMADTLDVNVGIWKHQIGSAHIYTEQLEEAKALAERTK